MTKKKDEFTPEQYKAFLASKGPAFRELWQAKIAKGKLTEFDIQLLRAYVREYVKSLHPDEICLPDNPEPLPMKRPKPRRTKKRA